VGIIDQFHQGSLANQSAQKTPTHANAEPSKIVPKSSSQSDGVSWKTSLNIFNRRIHRPNQ